MYFFNRGVLKCFDSVRFDKSVSSSDIINTIQARDERTLLFNLLNISLSSKVKSQYVNAAIKKGIIRKKQFKMFCNALYDFRCSVVHAKDSKKKDCYIPEIVSDCSDLAFWIVIIKDICKRVINDLNVI